MVCIGVGEHEKPRPIGGGLCPEFYNIAIAVAARRAAYCEAYGFRFLNNQIHHGIDRICVLTGAFLLDPNLHGFDNCISIHGG